MNTGKRAFFLYDDWVNSQKRRVQLVPGKIGENNTYKARGTVYGPDLGWI